MLANLLKDKKYRAKAVKPVIDALFDLRDKQHLLHHENLQYFDLLSHTGIAAGRFNHSPIVDYFYGSNGSTPRNMVWEGKPVFFIRLHGSHGKKKYHLLRRTSVTELKNAYIVFADNYLVRHIWEMHFFGYFEQLHFLGVNLADALYTLISAAELSVAGRMVTQEKEFMYFACSSPKTSGLDLYFSHFYDVAGEYTINGKKLTFEDFKVKQKEWLSAGIATDWTQSHTLPGDRKIRQMLHIELEKEDLAFLRAYNVRLLSPFFMFTFPCNRKFAGTINGRQVAKRGLKLGEELEIRRLFFRHNYRSWNAQQNGISLQELMARGGVSEDDIQEMLKDGDTIDIYGLPDAEGGYYHKPAKKDDNTVTVKATTVRKPKVPKQPKQPIVAFKVTFQNGNELTGSSMPDIVAAILHDFAATKQIISLKQLAETNPQIASMIYQDLDSDKVQSIKSGKDLSKSDKSGRLIYRVPFKVGTETGILTKNWYKEPRKNFETFKSWAESKGYTFKD